MWSHAILRAGRRFSKELHPKCRFERCFRPGIEGCPCRARGRISHPPGLALGPPARRLRSWRPKQWRTRPEKKEAWKETPIAPINEIRTYDRKSYIIKTPFVNTKIISDSEVGARLLRSARNDNVKRYRDQCCVSGERIHEILKCSKAFSTSVSR